MTTDNQIGALRDLVIKTLDDGKAENIIDIDLHGKSTIADRMIIASGGSSRQVSSLARKVTDEVAKNFPGTKRRVEGLTEADWVLVDLGDIIVHLFRPEVRNFYSLEKMWGTATPSTEHRRMVSKRAGEGE